MLTVADELFISGLPDDTRAIIEKHIKAEVEERSPRADARFCVDCGGKFDLEPDKDERDHARLVAYQRGWKDAIEEAGASSPPSVLPSELSA